MCGNITLVPAIFFFLRGRDQSRLEKSREVLLDPIRVFLGTCYDRGDEDDLR